MPFYKDVYDKQNENDEYKPKEELIQNLVDDLEKQLIVCVKKIIIFFFSM